MGSKAFLLGIMGVLFLGGAPVQAEARSASAAPQATSQGTPRPAFAPAGKKVAGKKAHVKPRGRSVSQRAMAKKAMTQKRIARGGPMSRPPAKASPGRQASQLARATRPAARRATHDKHTARPASRSQVSVATQRRADGADFAHPPAVAAKASSGQRTLSAAQADLRRKRQLQEMIGREEENLRRELAGQGRLSSMAL